jgi:predicted  nucleic acid-binding Zn-ribbon protein
LGVEVTAIDAPLNPNLTSGPSAEEIARIQAEMQKMQVEIETCNARVEANQLEIDRLRTETHDILVAIAEVIKH